MENYRIIEITDHTRTSQDKLACSFGFFHNLSIWVGSLEITYPNTNRLPPLARVVYIESDGFRWSYDYVVVTCVPEKV
jgi:hypothetical protein